MSKTMIWAISIVVIIGVGAILAGPISSHVEQAPYKVSDKQGNIEIREYPSLVVAEVEVTGEREVAIKKGFKMVADYIFGDNHSTEQVAMTAPVTQKTSQKIAMTAPVTQKSEGDSWVISFVMPSSYKLETLPRPNHEQIKLRETRPARYAVIQFSGKATTESLEKETAELRAFIKEKGLKVMSGPTYAFFNPPWTLPFLRRNEVMIEVE